MRPWSNLEGAQTNGRLELSKARAAYAPELAIRCGFLLVWYFFLARILLPLITPFLLAWPWHDLFQQLIAGLTELIARGGGELSPSAQATLFPVGLLFVTMACLLFPLLGLPKLYRLARIILAGEVLTFDRDTRQFQRNGKVIAPLDSIARVRILQPSFSPDDGKAQYRLSIILVSGRPITITIDGSWGDELAVHRLAQQIADHVHVELVRD
jgi:hypothetical protein